MAPELDEKLFDEYRSLIYEKSGISLNENKILLVKSRISRRMKELGFTNFNHYLEFVIDDDSGEELVHMLDVISTNVTRFFREEQHFEILEKVTRDWAGQGQKQFRFWSAACSTGEEIYSMIMALMPVLGYSVLDWNILASDISTRVIDYAKTGIYPIEKISDIPEHLQKNYTKPVFYDEQECFKMNASLKDKVHYKRINLSKVPYVLRGPFDAIFCRNVMIYFDKETKVKAVDEFYRLLKDGGYLFLGGSENLTGISDDFETVSPAVYRKVGDE